MRSGGGEGGKLKRGRGREAEEVDREEQSREG